MLGIKISLSKKCDASRSCLKGFIVDFYSFPEFSFRLALCIKKKKIDFQNRLARWRKMRRHLGLRSLRRFSSESAGSFFLRLMIFVSIFHGLSVLANDPQNYISLYQNSDSSVELIQGATPPRLGDTNIFLFIHNIFVLYLFDPTETV